MILNFLMSRMIWMKFITILGNITLIKNTKFWLYLTLWFLLCLVIKILNSLVTELLATVLRFARNLLEHFSCFYYTRFSCSSTHYFILKIMSKESFIYSFIRYWIPKLYNLYKKMYCKTKFIFSDWCYSCIRSCIR